MVKNGFSSHKCHWQQLKASLEAEEEALLHKREDLSSVLSIRIECCVQRYMLAIPTLRRRRCSNPWGSLASLSKLISKLGSQWEILFQTNKKDKWMGCRDISAVTIACCSCRRPKLGSQQPHGSSRPRVTPNSRISDVLFWPPREDTHICTYTHT